MEHLPVKDGKSPIIVRYIPGPKYDGGEYASYPQRLGWDFSLWLSSDAFLNPGDLETWLRFNQKDLDELPAFLQTWLFFGLLATVIDAEVPLEDFVRLDFDGGSYLTTTELTRYLEEWDRLIQVNTSPVIDKTAHLAELSNVLNDATAINQSLSRLICTHGLFPSPYLEQLQGVHFCAALLLRALSVAIEHVLGRRPGILKLGGQPGRLPLLEDRVHEAGWCPFTTFQLSNNFPEDTQVYAFSLGTIGTKLDHESCTFQSCIASQSRPGASLQHTRDGCDCEVIEAPTERIVEALQLGKIPLLHILNENGRPYINVYNESGDSNPYVVISHVWADGIGTSTSNTITTCQALELADSMKVISSETALPFWLDTLCIPVEPQHRKLRDFSVQKMHEIYKSSHGMLILDADLKRLPSNASYAEIMTRFSISAWNTRLWTYHESALAPRHFIRGRDTVSQLESLQQRVLDGEFQDSIAHSLNLFAAASFSVLIRDTCGTKDSKASDLETQSLITAISNRTTSSPEDETICIATYIGLDVSPLLNSPPARRMETLLSLLPSIPANVLWGSGPRLVTRGFRWAPASFLQPYGMVPLPVPDLVPASAASLHTEMIPRPLSYLHPTGKGLMAFLPAISVSNIDFSRQRFLVDVGEGEVYRLGFFLKEGGRARDQGRPRSMSIAKRSFVVLLALFFHDEYRGYDVKQKGILAEVVGKTKDPSAKTKRFSFKQVTMLEYREPMFVERTSRSGDFGGGDEGKAWFRGEHVQPKWWLID